MIERPSICCWGGALLGARKDQQDAFLIHDLDASGGVLAVVADGMGGQAAGGLASKTAANAFRDAFVNVRNQADVLDEAFDAALEAANAAIERAQKGRIDREGMGTTLLAVQVSSRGLSWISVGDSPLLLSRNDTVTRLNEDHSLRSLPEFRGGPSGNMLRSALTGQEIALVDRQTTPMPLSPNDVILLASDGILTLSESEIVALLAVQGDRAPAAIGQRLLDGVSQKKDPRQDNCTVLVIGSLPSSMPKPPALSPMHTPVRAMPVWMIILFAFVAIALAGEVCFAWLW